MVEKPAAGRALSVVIERDLPHPPEKVWRALTQPHLVEEWLMKADIRPVVGHRFALRMQPQPDRTFVFECEVVVAEQNSRLSYTWNTPDDEDGDGLRSVVTFTLTPTGSGTRLRMEQSGFRPDQPQYHRGAVGGWHRFLGALEALLARLG